MLPFLHHRLQLLQQLLERSSEVLVKYNRFDLDLAVALTEFLDEAITLYGSLNDASAENELLVLKAQFVSAQNGTHPLTLERVTNHRREMMRAIALLVLQQSALKLRTDTEQVTQKLYEGRTQLRPITLVAMQKGLIPQHDPLSQSQLEDLWLVLLEEPEIQLAARQLAMQLSLFDIHLLLSDLISAPQQVKTDLATVSWTPSDTANPKAQSDVLVPAPAAMPPDQETWKSDRTEG